MAVSNAYQAPLDALKKLDISDSLREANAPVFHILVVGFHHQKGCVVEYLHPPLAPSSSSSPDSSLTSQLPPEWRHLPHLALPDGCHNYEQDASFFVLHAPHHSNGDTQEDEKDNKEGSSARALYGIACCRQVDSKEVKPSSDITRSTVQKSVCVLCKYPLFGAIEAKLSQVTQAYFEVKDFSRVSILHDALASLNSTFRDARSTPPDMLLVGLDQQSLVLKFGHRLLQIFKALLLHKRVLVCGVPTNEVCKTVLAILSLFPGSLDSMVRPDLKKKSDNCGFPLQTFSSPFSVQPYVCLQQMDELIAATAERAGTHLLVGVANPLFQKQYSKYCDVYADLEEGLVSVKDPDLRSTLYLTAADLRFCDFVYSSVREVTTPTSLPVSRTAWFGSSGWVRFQFRLYLLSLLATSLSNQPQDVDEFGACFVEKWLRSSTYVNWKLSHKTYAGLAKVEPMHLCRSDMTLRDLRLRLSAQASDYGFTDRSKERVSQVLGQTKQAVGNVGGAVGGAVGGVWSAASAASAALSSWWYGNEEDDN